MNNQVAIYILLVAIVAVNSIFIVRFIMDFVKHRKETFEEKGSNIFYIILAFITQFLSTFGISDFAINTIVYNRTKVIEDRLIPPTLNTECVIPVMTMALIYITSIGADIKTLVILVVAQTLGSLLSPRIVVKLPANVIRWFMGIGLAVAALIILLGQLKLIPSEGTLTGLTGTRLIIAVVALFIFGALNNIGVGSYAPTMATIYALGLNPLVAFPIMMSACTFSCAVGASEFVRFKNYARKATFWFAIVGSISVFFAATIVKSLNLYYLKWVVLVVVIIASANLLVKEIGALVKKA